MPELPMSVKQVQGEAFSSRLSEPRRSPPPRASLRDAPPAPRFELRRDALWMSTERQRAGSRSNSRRSLQIGVSTRLVEEATVLMPAGRPPWDSLKRTVARAPRALLLAERPCSDSPFQLSPTSSSPPPHLVLPLTLAMAAVVRTHWLS
jgi:hypothetical protein